MECTAAEIEEKRRLAKEKLLKKRSKSSPPHQQQTSAGSKHFTLKQSAPGTENCLESRSSSNPLPTTSSTSSRSPAKNVGNFDRKPHLLLTSQKISATCVLQSATCFTVKLSKFFHVALDIFKSIPSRKYDPKTTHWSFNLSDYALLLKRLDALQSELVVHRLPAWIHCLNSSTATDASCFDSSHIDEELRNTLMPFQEDSLSFAIQRNGRCYIADEMGLGKTVQALTIAAYYRNDWPVLVVTTASTCVNWEVTISKYLPSIPLRDIQYISKQCDCIDKPAVMITSYDMMTRRTADLIRSKCGVCIFDEAHTLKNFKTKCFKAALSLSKCVKRVVLLSGTPALSKPSELFTQLQLIDEAFFGSFVEFSKRYCDGRESSFGWDSSGCSNLEELQLVLEQRFMLRRTKAGMRQLDLPLKTHEIVQLDMNVKMNATERDHWQRIQATDLKRAIKTDHQILPFFHNTATIKIPAVTAYVQEVIKQETRKLLIFAHHMNMLDAVEKVLRDSRKEYIRIDGRSSNRGELVERFQVNENVRCALLSITAANSGITLTSAQLVIFAELHWTPSILAQAEARAHRIGQQHPVTVRYLIAPKTIDDYIWTLLQSKQTILKDMKLMAEPPAKFEVVKAAAADQQNTLAKYFSPTKRPRDESPISKHTKKLHRTVTDATNVEKLCCDELEDEMDDFFKHFTTEAITKSDESPSSENIFNDDLDQVLLKIDC